MNNPTVEEFTIRSEFLNSISNHGILQFCQKAHQYNFNDDEKFIHYEKCQTCKKTCCKTCLNICHQNCRQKEKPNLPFFTVFEFYSSCECNHDKFNPEEKHFLPCFFSYFLGKELKLKNNYYVNNDDMFEVKCLFCYENCSKNKDDYSANDSLNDLSESKLGNVCSCDNFDIHENFDIKMNFYVNCFEKANIEVEVCYSKIRETLKTTLKNYLEINDVKNLSENFIQSEIDKFSIYLLMYKTNLKYELKDENQLIESLMQKLRRTDKHYFIQENTNLTLTYFYHFLNKNFFQIITMVNARSLSNLCLQDRYSLLKMNKGKRLELIKEGCEILKEESLKDLLERILNLKNHYSIRLTDEEDEVPFFIFLIKCLSQTYSFDQYALKGFFVLIDEITYKKNYNEYNNLIRKNLDELFFICQVGILDCNIEKLENPNDFYLLVNSFFFSSDRNPTSFYNKIFQNENIYLIKPDEEIKKVLKEKGEYLDDEYLKYLKNMKQDSLYYFDCFHNTFIMNMIHTSLKEVKEKKFSEKMKNFFSHKILIESSKKLKSKEYEEYQKKKNKIAYFRYFTISIHTEIKQEEILKFYIGRILHNFNLDTIKEKVVKLEDFQEDLFLKLLTLNKLNRKNPNNTNKIIKITQNLNKPITIDLKKIDITPFGDDLVYIFYIMFILDFNKNPKFQKIMFDWNLLLFIISSNENNVFYLVKDLKFFDFLLDVHNSEDEKKEKKSFLIRSLYNTNKNVKENNFTWRYFYIIYKFYIDKQDVFNYQKKIIMEKFLNEIIDFYNIKYQIEEHDVNLYNKSNYNLLKTMNYPVIYYFLKVMKNILIKSNPNVFLPFNYNVNKFETLEKINILANILFQDRFDVEKYLKTFIKFSGKTENTNNNEEEIDFCKNAINNIEENDHLNNEKFEPNINSDIRKGSILTSISLKKLKQSNIQLLILDILGNTYSSPDINIYYNIIKYNFDNFKDFLLNKVKYVLNSTSKKYIYKLEMILIKFLLNFLTIKHYNYSNIELISSLDFTKEDLLVFAEMPPDNPHKDEIEFHEISIKSKFLINKYKIKILNLFIIYVQNFIVHFYNSSEINQEIGSLILISLVWILKEIYLNILEKISLNESYETTLKNFLILFLENKNKFDLGKNDVIEKDIQLFDLYDKFKTYLKSIDRKNIQFYSKFTFFRDSTIYRYLQEFIKFDTKQNSTYCDLVDYMLDGIYENNKELSMNKHDKEKFRKVQEFSYFYWSAINKKFTKKNNQIKMKYILNYLLNHLINLEKKYDQLTNIIFDFVFSENFLKILNFLNNILYYRPLELQKFLGEKLQTKQMAILMKNVIKLSNYIIGMSEYENNEKLIASSKIYFTLMDFFILLREGIFQGAIINFFFMDLEIDDYKIEENYTTVNTADVNREEFKTMERVRSMENFKSKANLKNLDVIDEYEENQHNQENQDDQNNQDNQDNRDNQDYQNDQYKKDNKDNPDDNKDEENKTNPFNKRKSEDVNITMSYHKMMQINRRFSTTTKIPANFYDAMISSDTQKKVHISLNNNIVNEENLNDSTDLDQNFEMIENKLDSVNIEHMPNLRKYIPEIVDDFEVIYKFNMEFLCDDNVLDIHFIENKLKQYAYMFKISISILQKFHIYIKEIVANTKNSNKEEYKRLMKNESKFFNSNFVENILEYSFRLTEFELETNHEKTLDFIQNQSDKHLEYYNLLLNSLIEFLIMIKEKFSDSEIPDKEVEDFLFKINEEILQMKSIFEKIILDSEDGFMRDYLTKLQIAVKEIKGEIHEEKFNIERSLIITSLPKNFHGDDITNKRLLKMKAVIINERDSLKKPEVNIKFLNEAEKKVDNFIIKDEENVENDLTNNFFYYQFFQMKLIIEKINVFQFNFISSGSERLIVQFTYITRFLKEFIELSLDKDNDKNREIINHCFLTLFDFNWLYSDYYYNDQYSLIIRSGLLKLLNAFLEENQGEYFEEKMKPFNKKIYTRVDENKILFEIRKCFSNNFNEQTNYSEDHLFFEYIKDETIYKDKKFQLSELYFQFIRQVEFLYDKLKHSYVFYRDELEQMTFYVKDNQQYKKSKEKIKMQMSQNDQTKFQKIKESCENDPERELNTKILNFIRLLGKQIEIKFIDHDNKFIKRKLYFFKSPKCFWMIKNMKDIFLESAVRTSLGAKIEHLNKNIDKFLLCINVSFKNKIIFKKNPLFFGRLYKYFETNYLNIINFIMISITNILLLIYFYKDSSKSIDGDLDTQMFISEKSDDSNLLKNRFSYIFFVTSLFTIIQIILVYIWILYRFNIFYQLNVLNYENKQFYLLKNYNSDDEFKSKAFKSFQKLKEKFDSEEFFEVRENESSKDFIQNWLIKINLSLHTLLNYDIFYLITCLILNILYLLSNNSLFLVLQVFSIINLYPLFGYFMRAILNKYKEFIALLIFIWFFEYIFSWITFLHFQENMISEHAHSLGKEKLTADTTPELLCSTAIECFLNYLHLGLRSGGGIGDVSPRVSFKYNSTNTYLLKIFWDIVFHIVINLILGNIFFGVIVDTFNELRDQKSKKDTDKNNRCYICNLDRYEINRGENFDYHRGHVHKINNYVFIIPYLLKKNPQEFSRAESY